MSETSNTPVELEIGDLVELDQCESHALSWGELTWMMGEEQTPGAELTFGCVTIQSGKRNPFHAHPNCEEVLFVLSGTCEHKLGDVTFDMGPGSLVRIPRGVKHWARCTSKEPLKAVIVFSAPDRQTVNYDGDGEA